MTTAELLDALWRDYVATTPQAARIHQLLGERGELVRNDHVALRTFALPGIGRLVVQSILRRDYPVIQGIILVIIVFYIMVNLIVDIITTYLDPRVKLQ